MTDVAVVKDKQEVDLNSFELKYALSNSIRSLVRDSGYGYIGSILQCMTINYSNVIPTAGVYYDKKVRSLRMLINPRFFMTELSPKERTAVLRHEIEHVLNKHVFFDIASMGWDMKLANVAMDLVINQTIPDLPSMALVLSQFRTKDGENFPEGVATEYYYDLLKDDAEVNKPNADGSPGTEWIKAKDAFKDAEGTLDSHLWQEGGVDQGELLKAAADLLRRAKEKAAEHGVSSNRLSDVLEEVETRIKGLDFKALLMLALRKSLPANFSRRTWKRHSRRFGDAAKGSIKAKMPKLEVFIDSSGSISMEEANEFLGITNNFLTVGVQSAYVNLFHTSVYKRKKVKKNFKIEEGEFESGGTCLQDCFDKLGKSRSDLAIFITDGYFGEVNLPKALPNVVFIISKGGTEDHPLKSLGKTVKYSG
jgi:predicted metal-dependent peptidase